MNIKQFNSSTDTIKHLYSLRSSKPLSQNFYLVMAINPKLLHQPLPPLLGSAILIKPFPLRDATKFLSSTDLPYAFINTLSPVLSTDSFAV